MTKLASSFVVVALLLHPLLSHAGQNADPKAEFEKSYDEANGSYEVFLGRWRLKRSFLKLDPSKKSKQALHLEFMRSGNDTSVAFMIEGKANETVRTQAHDAMTQNMVLNNVGWYCRVNVTAKQLLCKSVNYGSNEFYYHIFVWSLQQPAPPKTEPVAVEPKTQQKQDSPKGPVANDNRISAEDLRKKQEEEARKDREAQLEYSRKFWQIEREYYEKEKKWYAEQDLTITVEGEAIHKKASIDVIVMLCKYAITDWSETGEACKTVQRFKDLRDVQTLTQFNYQVALEEAMTYSNLVVMAVKKDEKEKTKEVWEYMLGMQARLIDILRVAASDENGFEHSEDFSITKSNGEGMSYSENTLKSSKFGGSASLNLTVKMTHKAALPAAESLRAVLKTKTIDPYTLVDAMAQMSAVGKALYSDSCGPKGFYLKEHVLRVLSILPGAMKCFIDEKLASELRAKDIDIASLFPVLMVLHDIGKPEACRANRRADQHDFTLSLLGKTLRSMGYSDSEITLSERLMDNDLIGEYMMGQDYLMNTLTGLTEQAKKAGLTTKQFFNLQMPYFISDAGSYPFIQIPVFEKDANGCMLPLHQLYEGKSKEQSGWRNPNKPQVPPNPQAYKQLKAAVDSTKE